LANTEVAVRLLTGVASAVLHAALRVPWQANHGQTAAVDEHRLSTNGSEPDVCRILGDHQELPDVVQARVLGVLVDHDDGQRRARRTSVFDLRT
jgi:hypothetical protein